MLVAARRESRRPQRNPSPREVLMSLSRRQIIAYVVLAVAVIAVGARYVITSRGTGGSTGEALVLSSASPSPTAAPPSPSPGAPDVVVYVCGAVRSPGVVRLPSTARVADALKVAGGATSSAELSAVNLAARLADGQQIIVPRRGEAPAAGGAAASATSGAAPPA